MRSSPGQNPVSTSVQPHLRRVAHTCRMRPSLVAAVLLISMPAGAAELYRLDSDNTRVSLDVRLFGVPWVSARFENISGELVPGSGAVPGPKAADAAGRVDVTIRTASLKCDSVRWNARLLSAAWFDAARFPEIVYRSEHIAFEGDGRAVVSGSLTLHGQTRSLTLDVNHWRCASRPGPADSCSFEAHGRLRRSDYDLPHGLLEGGDEVEIAIQGIDARPQGLGAAG